MADNPILKWLRDAQRILATKKDVIFLLSFAVLLGWELFVVWKMPLVVDENYHFLKIQAARSGDFSLAPYLTMLPVYHDGMGLILNLVQATTLGQARLVTLLGSLGTCAAFYLLVKRLWPDEALWRTAQFLVLPILFPFLPLFYTDIWALGFVLLAVERSLAARPKASAAAAFIATLLRTPNIVWGLLAWLLLYRKEEGPAEMSSQRRVIRLQRSQLFILLFAGTLIIFIFHHGAAVFAGLLGWLFLHSVKDHRDWMNVDRLIVWFRRTWGFILLFLGFSIFLVLNHGAAVGDRQNQAMTWNPSNVWFFLFIIFFTFMPTCLAQVRVFLRPVTPKVSIVGIAVIVAVFCFHTYAFHHFFNSPVLWFYLQNRLLHWTIAYPIGKGLALIPILLALFGLAFAPLARPELRWIVPIAFSSILLMPVIELRYYLEALALFQAFRRSQSLRWEMMNLAFYLLLSLWLVTGIAAQRFFL